MRLTAQALKQRLHRAVLALLLLAFVVPGPARLPADEVRDSYAALGLLCDPGSPADSHREAHCVLCLLPGAHGTSDSATLAVPSRQFRVVQATPQADLNRAAPFIAHPARAPPPSIV